MRGLHATSWPPVPLLSGLPLVVSAIAFQWQIQGFVKGRYHLPTPVKDTQCSACFSFPLSSPWREGWGGIQPSNTPLPVFTDFSLKLSSISNFYLLFVCFCCFHFIHLISSVVSMHFQIITSLSDAKVKDQDKAADHTVMASVQVMTLDVSTKH